MIYEVKVKRVAKLIKSIYQWSNEVKRKEINSVLTSCCENINLVSYLQTLNTVHCKRSV